MKQGAPHTAQIKHLKRVEGQVRGILGMVEEKRYCIDILTQIKAVKASLGTIERKIIDEHLSHCVHDAIRSKNSEHANEMLDEIRQLMKSVKT